MAGRHARGRDLRRHDEGIVVSGPCPFQSVSRQWNRVNRHEPAIACGFASG